MSFLQEILKINKPEFCSDDFLSKEKYNIINTFNDITDDDFINESLNIIAYLTIHITMNFSENCENELLISDKLFNNFYRMASLTKHYCYLEDEEFVKLDNVLKILENKKKLN